MVAVIVILLGNNSQMLCQVLFPLCCCLIVSDYVHSQYTVLTVIYSLTVALESRCLFMNAIQPVCLWNILCTSCASIPVRCRKVHFVSFTSLPLTACRLTPSAKVTYMIVPEASFARLLYLLNCIINTTSQMVQVWWRPTATSTYKLVTFVRVAGLASKYCPK